MSAVHSSPMEPSTTQDPAEPSSEDSADSSSISSKSLAESSLLISTVSGTEESLDAASVTRTFDEEPLLFLVAKDSVVLATTLLTLVARLCTIETIS